eukprot:2799953-Lingulodinium_polyedra.AAC.1
MESGLLGEPRETRSKTYSMLPGSTVVRQTRWPAKFSYARLWSKTEKRSQTTRRLYSNAPTRPHAA